MEFLPRVKRKSFAQGVPQTLCINLVGFDFTLVSPVCIRFNITGDKFNDSLSSDMNAHASCANCQN